MPTVTLSRYRLSAEGVLGGQRGVPRASTSPRCANSAANTFERPISRRPANEDQPRALAENLGQRESWQATRAVNSRAGEPRHVSSSRVSPERRVSSVGSGLTFVDTRQTTRPSQLFVT